ncbi:MAG: transcriptional regulator [Parvibaculum sp.]|nr:transcriptional regulator [Parvibaculum sp.]
MEWRAIVDEALRRRKAERLTQREHAALAGVSIPTIAAFDRGENTLTLAKAFDILRVVGLLNEPGPAGAQERFMREAFERWQFLTASLPPNSPARFPNGWYRFDYWLEGDLKSVRMTDFETIMRDAKTRHTGWPVFITLTKSEFAPREVDSVLECWLPPEGKDYPERMFGNDPAHCDFWRATPSGRLFLIRGYEEDGQETFPPGTLMDTTRPIWRLGETLLHAERLASLMRAHDDTEIMVHFRALYTGLSGRVLRSWANPMIDLFVEGYAARSNEVLLETSVPATGITENLAEHLFPMITDIFERFGVVGLSADGVRSEVQRLLRSHI